MAQFASAGEFLPKIVSANTTLKYSDFAKHWCVVNTATGVTITLPTPIRGYLDQMLLFVNGYNGALTLSCSSGFVGGVSTVTVPAYGSVIVIGVLSGAGTYRWASTVATSLATASGTGIPHVVSGVTQGATSLIVDADVDAAAAIALSKVVQPAPAAFSPTPAWTTATPTVSAAVYRQQTVGKVVSWVIDITCSDGKGATLLDVTFPSGLVPANVSQKVPCSAEVSVNNGALAQVPSYVIADDATEGNRVLHVITGTLTNAQAARVIVRGFHEIP